MASIHAPVVGPLGRRSRYRDSASGSRWSANGPVNQTIPILGPAPCEQETDTPNSESNRRFTSSRLTEAGGRKADKEPKSVGYADPHLRHSNYRLPRSEPVACHCQRRGGLSLVETILGQRPKNRSGASRRESATLRNHWPVSVGSKSRETAIQKGAYTAKCQ